MHGCMHLTRLPGTQLGQAPQAGTWCQALHFDNPKNSRSTPASHHQTRHCLAQSSKVCVHLSNVGNCHDMEFTWRGVDTHSSSGCWLAMQSIDRDDDTTLATAWRRLEESWMEGGTSGPQGSVATSR